MGRDRAALAMRRAVAAVVPPQLWRTAGRAGRRCAPPPWGVATRWASTEATDEPLSFFRRRCRFIFVMNFFITISLHLIRIADCSSHFLLVHMGQHDTVCLPCHRAGTTRLSGVRVVHGSRNWHGVPARHDTTGLSCLAVSFRIVSCLAVSVSCRAAHLNIYTWRWRARTNAASRQLCRHHRSAPRANRRALCPCRPRPPACPQLRRPHSSQRHPCRHTRSAAYRQLR
jgi:hypothetical protein